MPKHRDPMKVNTDPSFAGHDAVVTAPEALAALLLESVVERQPQKA